MIYCGCLGTFHKEYFFNQSFIVKHLGCFPFQKNVLQVKERIAFGGKQSPGQQRKSPCCHLFPLPDPILGGLCLGLPDLSQSTARAQSQLAFNSDESLWKDRGAGMPFLALESFSSAEYNLILGSLDACPYPLSYHS